MTKETESLAIFAALGMTAFVLWRAWRDGRAWPTSSPTAPAAASAKSTAMATLVPKADDFISSIYNSGGGGGSGTWGSGGSGVVLSNGSTYGQGSDPGYSGGM